MLAVTTAIQQNTRKAKKIKVQKKEGKEEEGEGAKINIVCLLYCIYVVLRSRKCKVLPSIRFRIIGTE